MIATQSLQGTWHWYCVGENKTREGLVPGSVLADLLKANLAEDPFWRTNEYSVREKFAKDYVYTTSFTITAQALAADDCRLVFEGIDTIADISLNGRLLAKVKDMHRRYSFPVKTYLAAGENTLEVYLHSALEFVREEDARSDIFYASTGSIHGNAALRKAHYMFGWDWGPQLPDMGIFRPVYISFAQKAELSDVRIRQTHGASVSLHVETKLKRYNEEPLHLAVNVTTPTGEVLCAAAEVPAGENSGLLRVDIPDPALWWPNGWGEQPLYAVAVSLSCGETVVDSYRCRMGLRTITVSTDPDPWGREFAFVVNGEKLFAMGANYVPEDNLLSRVTAETSRKLIENCAKANFNMLRIWGGGYYPDDGLYDACDECGILVWQDLMFACNVYALDEAGDFEQNIIAETADNVCRLRHHPCLALWCGNNEMEWGWGDEWLRIKGHHPKYKADYIKIFEFILSRTVHQYDDSTFWWPSSPSSGGAFDKPNHADFGDQHYWEVWHSGKPFTEYRKSHFRFCSEYGFQSFPHSKSIERFTLPEDRNIFGEVMESHQKNGAANTKIFTYVADYFLYPKDLDAIAYISQVLQLKAIQYGVEHWRQNRGRCMGSLYWQLNDCWPVASWASIDYYGRWKALHHGARRFYTPLMASACEREELSSEITYYVHNDSRTPRQCTLEVALIDTDFQVLTQQRVDVSMAALSVQPQLTVDFEAYLTRDAKKRVFARYRLLEQGRVVSGGTTLFVKPKHFDLPQVTYSTEVTETSKAFTIRLRSTGFSLYTEVYFTDCDPVLDDNFFDITSAEGVSLTVSKQDLPETMTAELLARQLVIRSVRDSF